MALPDRDGFILAIILASDLECDLDWGAIAQELLEASDGRSLFQMLDLTQLRALVGTAKNRLQFISNLVIRFAHMRDKQTALLRVRVWRDKD